MTEQNLLKFYIKPLEPINADELALALFSLQRQYQIFGNQLGLGRVDARLRVDSVSRGSIDIGLLTDIFFAGSVMLPLIEKAELVAKFADHIRSLIKVFTGTERPLPGEISVRDCEDTINILRPVAEHGGSQVFITINGGVQNNFFETSADEARIGIASAASEKVAIQRTYAERHNGVSMIWNRLDRDRARTIGKRSPDQGLITDIDAKPHAVLFTDEMSHIKSEMIADEANPYQTVYFVDVEVSRVLDRVAAYRVVGYHGKEEFDGNASDGVKA
jgi:hypothetical protein